MKKLFLLLIVGMFMITLVSAENEIWNVTENVSSINYQFSWTDKKNFTDNDFSTKTTSTGIVSVMTFNYTKLPNLYLFWEVKDGIGTTNLTLNESCLLDNSLNMFILSDNTNKMEWWCTNKAETFSKELRDVATRDAYEERVWWLQYNETSQTYNETIYGGQTSIFSLNVSSAFTVNNATLNYNGTEYSGNVYSSGDDYIINTSFVTPLVTSDTNKTFYWTLNIDELGDINSTAYNQTIFHWEMYNCSSGNSSSFIHFTFKDELTSTNINASISEAIISYKVTDGSTWQTFYFSQTAEVPSYDFCIIPSTQNYTLNITLPHYASGYPLRTYSINNLELTNTTTNQTLYLASSSDGVYENIQVVNPAGQPISGATIIISRYIGGVLTIISTQVTASNGVASFWLNPNYLHYISVTASGYEDYSASFYPTGEGQTISMGISTQTEINDYNKGIKINILPSIDTILYNGTTYNFNLTMSSTYWNLEEFGFYLIYQNGTIIGQKSSTSPSGGFINLNFNTANYSYVRMKYYWVINGSTQTRNTEWGIINSAYTGWSIKTFFTDLNSYISTDMFGLDDFGRNLIIYLLLFISIGVMSYKYGLTNPMLVLTIVFGVVYTFDVVIGLLPNPVTAIPNFLTWLVGLIMVVVMMKEVMKG